VNRALLYRMARALPPLEALRARLGLRRLPAEVPDHVAELLTAAAERFLRAGGALTSSEWIALSSPERAAFIAAGDRVRADTAIADGLAAQGLGGLLAVHGVLDGGKAQRRLELEIAAKQIADRRKAPVRS